MLESVQLPSTWATKSYNNRTYYLIELSYYSSATHNEYTQVADYFDNYKVIKIERVQNPYQYGKYEIYKLQKGFPNETISFMPARSSSELETALKYNCDYRRLGYSTDMFFSSVSQAVNFSNSCEKLIILQTMQSYKNHDSGRYPKYVVTYEKDY